MIPRYAELVYYPLLVFCRKWESYEKPSMKPGESVTGTARIKLYKGSCTVAGRKSQLIVSLGDFPIFEEDTVYRQKDAEGFIKINACGCGSERWREGVRGKGSAGQR